MFSKRVAKKFLSVLLAGTLVLSTGAPVSVSASETPDGITEVSVADVLAQETAETEEAKSEEAKLEAAAQSEEVKSGDTTDLPADLNEIVTVDKNNMIIDLNGASVVVITAEYGATYSRIFPDYDGDKVPDNQIPLIIDGQDYCKLKYYELRGYSDPSKPFEGDISITLSGGDIKNVYGIYGTENAPVSVNGDVKLYLEGVNASGGNAITSYYGKAENVTFSFTKRHNSKVEMYAAYKSEIDKDVNFVFGEQAQLQGESDTLRGRIGVATGSTIGGDVNAAMGFETEDGFMRYNTRYYYTNFLGITDTKVKGSVNYDLDGIWNPGSSMFLQNSTIGKDVNMRVVSKNFNQMAGTNEPGMIVDSTVNGNLNFTSDAEIGLASGGSIYLLRGTSAEQKSTLKGNLYVDIPLENIGSAWRGIGANAVVEGSIYSNVAGSVTIDTIGSDSYLISENLDGKELIICEDANVVIAEGVSVELSRDLDLQTGAKLVNNGNLSVKLANRSDEEGSVAGTLENKGSLDVEYSSNEIRGQLIIDATGLIINGKDAIWNVGCYIDNQGKIVNYGSFVQTYDYVFGGVYYYAKLGEVFTTQPLTLSHSINTAMYTTISDSKYNSKMYYAINVDYPARYVSAPTLTGTEIISSGLSGDENQYIRMARVGDGITSDFTLTPGAIKIQDCVLEEVTYGTAKKTVEPTKTAEGEVYTASVLGEFAPITITLDYGEAAEITPISLDKSSDSVNGLAVDQTYTQASPLYDLSSLTIIGDIVSEEGSVVYSHASGQLPKGIVFQDGKLYGTCKEASNTETVLTFTVTGLNLTTADFTLTLGAVAKAVPRWSLPTGFVGKVGRLVEDVQLPMDSRGEYTWENGEQALTVVGTAVTNIIFTPNSSYSTDNYDWAAAAGDAWDEENGRIYCPVQIKVLPGEPSLTAPTGLTAVYGQTFADVSLPSDENGRFAWDTDYHALTDTVGNAGEHTYYVTYWPTSESYTEKRGIAVKLIVNPATPAYEETLSQVEIFCDEELGDVLLPDVDSGSYRWISATSTKPKDQEQYSVIYLPRDIMNYDWTVVDGWDDERKGVVFSVQIKVMHAWNEGVITVPPTKEEVGEKVYTCGLCGETKNDILDKLPDDNTEGDDNTGGDDSTGDNGNITGNGSGEGTGNTTGNGSGEGAGATGDGSNAEQESAQPQVGYTLSDKKSKAVYKVSVVEKEVTYVKPIKKTYTKVKIPNTIKYDGVTYKVTAIANNAFKNNKKLKSVTIGTNIEMIGNSAFRNCTALKSVTIPKNVSKIGSKAFYGCKKLLKMTIKTTKLTEKNVGKQAFTKMGSSNYKKVTVKVPKKKVKSYKKMLQKRGLNKKAKVKK